MESKWPRNITIDQIETTRDNAEIGAIVMDEVTPKNQANQVHGEEKTPVLNCHQKVTESTRFVDRLCDITDDLCISGYQSIKTGKISGSKTDFLVDSDKFIEGDLNLFLSIKVICNTTNNHHAFTFNSLPFPHSDKFQEVYGDSFISGFVEGGEFNALISKKFHDESKVGEMKAEIKASLARSSTDGNTLAILDHLQTRLETNAEIYIQVGRSGGGYVEATEQQWDIKTLMEAASRFSGLVAQQSERTYAILTRYETLRSFLTQRPPLYTSPRYEVATFYTNVLLDSFMMYKAMEKRIRQRVVNV